MAEFKEVNFRDEAMKSLQKPLVKHKLVLLGDMNVGKSSIFQRFITGEFPESHEPTIGSCYNFKNVEFEEHIVRVELWDTAGQERFHSLAALYYKNAQAACVVYDVTSEKSFERAQKWIEELHEKGGADIVVALTANKIDAEGHKVPREEAMTLAQEQGLLFMEVSAKENTNVDNLFRTIAQKLPQKSAKKDAMSLLKEKKKQEEEASYCSSC